MSESAGEFRGYGTARLQCPACGGPVTGRWTDPRAGQEQACACGHVFPAAWPGWTFQPDAAAE